jgi:hypothetical protein
VHASYVFPKQGRLGEDGHLKEADKRPQIVQRVLNGGSCEAPANMRLDEVNPLKLFTGPVPYGMSCDESGLLFIEPDISYLRQELVGTT